MSLNRLVSGLTDHLNATLVPVPTTVGGMEPTAAGDLPAVTIWATDVTTRLIGIGGLPSPSRTGALRVDQDFDLANPTLTFPDGEVVDLLSGDRLSLHLPFGPAVAADGTETSALAAPDLDVAVDATSLTVVAGSPAAGEVRGDPSLGELQFGSPLPAAGTLSVGFFVGEWEVRLSRYQGTLHLGVFDGTGPDAAALSARVETAIAAGAPSGVTGLLAATPASLGPVLPPAVDNGGAHRRELTYAFDYELEEPVLGTGGGVIGVVEVDSTFGPEEFDVVREGSSL